jgi:hypothetical protein
MQSNKLRALAGIAVVAVAIVLLVVLKDDSGGGDSSNSSATNSMSGGHGGDSASAKVPTIAIRGGKPVGGIAELTYAEGDRIHFKVRSDVSDEIHIHGYDLMKDVEAGGTVSFDFPATIEGVFEAELEGRKEQIAELRVNP